MLVCLCFLCVLIKLTSGQDKLMAFQVAFSEDCSNTEPRDQIPHGVKACTVDDVIHKKWLSKYSMIFLIWYKLPKVIVIACICYCLTFCFGSSEFKSTFLQLFWSTVKSFWRAVKQMAMWSLVLPTHRSCNESTVQYGRITPLSRRPLGLGHWNACSTMPLLVVLGTRRRRWVRVLVYMFFIFLSSFFQNFIFFVIVYGYDICVCMWVGECVYVYLHQFSTLFR